MFIILCYGSAIFVYSADITYAHIFVSNDDNSSFLTLIERVRIEAQLVNSTIRTNITSAQEHIEQLLDRLDDVIDSDNYFTIKSEQFGNSTVNALLLANIVDEILRYYGEAYGILPNMMLNMSYMTAAEGINDAYNTHNKNGLSEKHMVIQHGNMNANIDNNNQLYYSQFRNANHIVDMDKYYTAKEYTKDAIRIFYSKLKPFETNSKRYAINKLENSLIELKSAVDSKTHPVQVMMIAHSKVHPSLQIAFDLKVKK
jgi:hypothetical protein